MRKLIIVFVSLYFTGLVTGCGGGANEDLRSTISPVSAATVGQLSGKILDGKTG